MVARDLAAGGVDISHISWDESGRLGTFFVELGPGPKGVSVTYDRQGSTAAAMSTDDLAPQEMARARLIHLTGITPALSRSCREATEAAATAARDSESLLSVDVNYRAQLWSTRDARKCLDRIGAGADLVVCTAEDARDVFGLEGDPAEVAASLADRLGSTYTVVTNGADGAVCWHNADAIRVAATPTHIVDRLGAGDAFTAGVIDGLLDRDIGEGLRRGSVLAAMALATRGDQVGVTRAELTQLLDPGGRRLNR
jgi:2-dehydro-3-deoxygluconokinase